MHVDLMLDSLDGLSVGDALGAGFPIMGRSLPDLQEAADELGNGSLVTAQNTVPFTIWVAAKHLDDYPAAITTCIAADGDIDTTSAIVGGIGAAYAGAGARPDPIVGVPQTWLAAREPLPGWFEPVRRTRRRENSGLGRVRRWLSGAR
ncbi:ADP-ribosylglycohydrolase family protein [Nocardia abscessus]|uniref:ADP-ribosylglycohydrolase family protein n=1 Tax=Nocardia TaxID=1817 RepID=UPI00189521AC|nr:MULTISPECIES: ADP-ribosylglycohydrolase family protein [Nocardia]MBF6220642.1 ADP-ribosylglycohydrolase family protein [Nocardia abscessus]MDE1671923.1 ADP-ribosylglycohydrolase family protein [Nocardia gipuzkoensis]